MSIIENGKVIEFQNKRYENDFIRKVKEDIPIGLFITPMILLKKEDPITLSEFVTRFFDNPYIIKDSQPCTSVSTIMDLTLMESVTKQMKNGRKFIDVNIKHIYESLMRCVDVTNPFDFYDEDMFHSIHNVADLKEYISLTSNVINELFVEMNQPDVRENVDETLYNIYMELGIMINMMYPDINRGKIISAGEFPIIACTSRYGGHYILPHGIDIS